jgi:hypothetical protein
MSTWPGARLRDDQLRQLYREDVDARGGGDLHPSEDDWIALTSGTLAPVVRDRLADHVVGCAECAAIHHALTEVRRDAAGIDPAVPALAGASSTMWWLRYGAVAAAALVVVALGRTLLDTPARDTAGAPVASAPAVAPPEGTGPADRRLAATPPSVLAPWATSVVALEVRLPAALVMTLRSEAPADADRRMALVRALRPALDLYRGGQYGPAAAALAPVAQAHPDVPEIGFYAGLSYLLDGNAVTSLPLLESAMASELVGDDARWFAAVAHERLGDHGRATEMLRALCARGGSRSRDACRAVSVAPAR